MERPTRALAEARRLNYDLQLGVSFMNEKERWLAKTKPLGESRIEISFQRTFTVAEAERLCAGLWPESMDDKWVVQLDETALQIWRSWTGHCIYVLPAQMSENGVTVGPLIVTGDRNIYRRTSDEHDIQIVDNLINRTLKQKGSVG